MFQKFDSVGTKPYFRASKLKLVPGKLTESKMCLKKLKVKIGLNLKIQPSPSPV